MKTETQILQSEINAPDCNLCGQPMMLQECNGECDNDPELHFEPQWACFCNGGNYRALVEGRQ